MMHRWRWPDFCFLSLVCPIRTKQWSIIVNLRPCYGVDNYCLVHARMSRILQFLLSSFASKRPCVAAYVVPTCVCAVIYISILIRIALILNKGNFCRTVVFTLSYDCFGSHIVFKSCDFFFNLEE